MGRLRFSITGKQKAIIVSAFRFAGVDVGRHRLDLVVEREIIVELKAVKALEDIFFVKLKSYLKATGLHVGLLMNFNSTALTIKRVVG